MSQPALLAGKCYLTELNRLIDSEASADEVAAILDQAMAAHDLAKRILWMYLDHWKQVAAKCLCSSRTVAFHSGTWHKVLRIGWVLATIPTQIRLIRWVRWRRRQRMNALFTMTAEAVIGDARLERRILKLIP